MCLCILLLLSRVGVESVVPAKGVLYAQALFVCLHYATRTLFELQVKGLYLVSKHCARIIITIRYNPIKHFSLLTVSYADCSSYAIKSWVSGRSLTGNVGSNFGWKYGFLSF